MTRPPPSPAGSPPQPQPLLLMGAQLTDPYSFLAPMPPPPQPQPRQRRPNNSCPRARPLRPPPRRSPPAPCRCCGATRAAFRFCTMRCCERIAALLRSSVRRTSTFATPRRTAAPQRICSSPAASRRPRRWRCCRRCCCTRTPAASASSSTAATDPLRTAGASLAAARALLLLSPAIITTAQRITSNSSSMRAEQLWRWPSPTATLRWCSSSLTIWSRRAAALRCASGERSNTTYPWKAPSQRAIYA